jgi:alkanesulfonate monooxygenase SsuD/methylene tetrahydromethanopterin reductase-like flavin-dependent oxidoreductase (luciferase family)
VDLVPPDGVEWWMGTMSEAGVRRAARAAMVWYPSPAATGDQLAWLLDRYRSACGDAGTEPQVALRRDAVVLDDGDRARRLAADAVSAGYRGLSSDVLLAGTPDDVAESLAPFADLGVDQIIGRTMGLDPAVDLDTIAGLGRVRSLLSADRR